MIIRTSEDRLEEAKDWARMASNVSDMQERFDDLVPQDGSIYEGVYAAINEFYKEATSLAGVLLVHYVNMKSREDEASDERRRSSETEYMSCPGKIVKTHPIDEVF